MSASLTQLLDRLIQAIAALLLVALLLVVALGVVTRGMALPLAWTDEISRFLMIWLAVFGWVLGTRARAHVRIRWLHDKFPDRIQRGLDSVIQLGMVLFGIAVGWHGIGLALKNMDLEATTIEISMGWVYAPLVIAGVMTALQGAIELLELAGVIGAPRSVSR